MTEREWELKLGPLGVALMQARQEVDRRKGTLRDAVLEALDDDMPEAAVARAASVTRATVREWAGKPRRGALVTAVGYHDKKPVRGPYRPRTDFPGAVPPADAAWVGETARDSVMVQASSVRVVRE